MYIKLELSREEIEEIRTGQGIITTAVICDYDGEEREVEVEIVREEKET